MKKLHYLVVDCETATLPCANEIAQNAEQKKKIAITKPLVYDIGWTIMERNGNIIGKKQFLVAETFAVPSVFNTAYYAKKRPLYLEMMRKGEIVVLPWDSIMEVFLSDLAQVDFVGAFNAMFDFKKAIPFTELYIRKLYSPDFNEWELMQKAICARIADGRKSNSNPDFDGENFVFRGESYPMFDIWGLSCSRLLNRNAYKNLCLDYGMITNSGEYFKTSAESSYRYLREYYDFEEAHTALADAEIESFILSKILHFGKIQTGIDYFPFQKLGKTIDYLTEQKKVKEAHIDTVRRAMENYLGEDINNPIGYKKHIFNNLAVLNEMLKEGE